MAERAPEFTRPTEPVRRRAPAMRERVRREIEIRPRRAPEVRGAEMTAAQKTSRYLGIASTAIGVLGFLAPAVTGNRDRVINTHNGKLLGVFAINPLHAFAHLGLGAWGVAASRSEAGSEAYLGTSTAVYGALALAGFIKGRDRDGIYEFMGMALNTADNWLHTVWAGASALFAARPRMGQAT